MTSLDDRILRLQLDVTVRPPPGAELGRTDAAMDLGKRLAIEAGLLARRMAGEGCTVEVDRQITVY